MAAREPIPQTAVVLIGHGSPATDCPPELIGQLMALEWRDERGGGGAQETEQRAAELDAKIRDWPRHGGNDPYKAGLERVATALRRLLPTCLFAVGYNEFCRPSVTEAVESVIEEGATRIFVVPSMLTPGGVHSERDIPRTLDALRRAHPGVRIDYVWPFEVPEVAALLAAHVQRAAQHAAKDPTA